MGGGLGAGRYRSRFCKSPVLTEPQRSFLPAREEYGDPCAPRLARIALKGTSFCEQEGL